MPSRKFKPPYPKLIHDHFDGSARCVECGGPCKLEKGTAARTATELARWMCERYAMFGWTSLPMCEASTLAEAGVSPGAFMDRAVKTTPWRFAK